jgi:hypothetical protein
MALVLDRDRVAITASYFHIDHFQNPSAGKGPKLASLFEYFFIVGFKSTSSSVLTPPPPMWIKS